MLVNKDCLIGTDIDSQKGKEKEKKNSTAHPYPFLVCHLNRGREGNQQWTTFVGSQR
jgi:hypothetical protein